MTLLFLSQQGQHRHSQTKWVGWARCQMATRAQETVHWFNSFANIAIEKLVSLDICDFVNCLDKSLILKMAFRCWYAKIASTMEKNWGVAWAGMCSLRHGLLCLLCKNMQQYRDISCSFAIHVQVRPQKIAMVRIFRRQKMTRSK